MFGDIFIVWEYSYFYFGVIFFGIVYLCYVLVFSFILVNLLVLVGFLILILNIYFLYFLNFNGFFMGIVVGYMLMIFVMIWRVIIGF